MLLADLVLDEREVVPLDPTEDKDVRHSQPYLVTTLREQRQLRDPPLEALIPELDPQGLEDGHPQLAVLRPRGHGYHHIVHRASCRTKLHRNDVHHHVSTLRAL